MFYTPKHCCECGEKIERDKWKPLTSRRFCGICESDFKFEDWLPRAVVGAGVLLALFGVGSLLKKSDPPLNVSTTPITAPASNKNRRDRSPAVATDDEGVRNSAREQTTAAEIVDATPAAAGAQTNTTHSTAPVKSLPAKQSPPDARQNSASRAVYFCGAQTKKGTPCTRRIRDGGRRCWQHEGQPAMLPPEKLVAGGGR